LRRKNGGRHRRRRYAEISSPLQNSAVGWQSSKIYYSTVPRGFFLSVEIRQ